MEDPIVGTSAGRELPRYKCHKEVWAFKIRQIELGDPNKPYGLQLIHPEDQDRGPVAVQNDYIMKHRPEVGGYYVVDEGGYRSFSPAKAFEEGYTRITEDEADHVE